MIGGYFIAVGIFTLGLLCGLCFGAIPPPDARVNPPPPRDP